jgi:hypothetical protein
MSGNADFRIGGGLMIRRSRRLDFAGILRRDQGKGTSRPSGRDQAQGGDPAEIVQQMIRLFSC